MQKINLPGMNLTDYSLRESISITDRFLGSGSLNTVLFISAKILVGTGLYGMENMDRRCGSDYLERSGNCKAGRYQGKGPHS